VLADPRRPLRLVFFRDFREAVPRHPRTDEPLGTTRIPLGLELRLRAVLHNGDTRIVAIPRGMVRGGGVGAGVGGGMGRGGWGGPGRARHSAIRRLLIIGNSISRGESCRPFPGSPGSCSRVRHAGVFPARCSTTFKSPSVRLRARRRTSTMAWPTGCAMDAVLGWWVHTLHSVS